jgi:hypothetical protein
LLISVGKWKKQKIKKPKRPTVWGVAWVFKGAHFGCVVTTFDEGDAADFVAGALTGGPSAEDEAIAPRHFAVGHIGGFGNTAAVVFSC